MSFSKLMTLSQLKSLGVRDDRWTIQDKLLMYKGLIKIYNREQKNQIKDTSVLKKKNYKKIAQLRKEVKELHEEVTLLMHSNRGLTRRVLQSHKDLQLCYANMSLDKVIEDLNHRIFRRKKNLNLIRHKKSQKEKELLESLVHLEDLKELTSQPDFLRKDLKQQNITNAIQNYDVKFCAAKNIQSVYRRMLGILQKDQRYYEAILVTLRSDSTIQHKCLIRATEMGQLAMEEMANMKYEYLRLEREVRANMADRENCLKEIRDRLVDLQEETQGLVRTESEFDIQMIQTGLVEEPKKKGKDLEHEIAELAGILKKLQEATLVRDFESIFPSMLETLRQKKRLVEELRINAEAFDDMLNKKNHADLMFYSLYHSGAEQEAEFKKKSEELQKKIDVQKTRLDKLLAEQNKVSDMSVRLRVGLQRLCQILDDIKTPPDFVDIDVPPWPVNNVAQSLRPKEHNEEGEEIVPKPPINEEALRLLNLLDSKLKYVKMRLKESGEPAEQERAFMARFKHVSEFIVNNLYPPEEVFEAPALIVDVVIEDPQIPNRLEIKARSQQIYIEATRNPFDVQDNKGRKGGRKK